MLASLTLQINIRIDSSIQIDRQPTRRPLGLNILSRCPSILSSILIKNCNDFNQLIYCAGLLRVFIITHYTFKLWLVLWEKKKDMLKRKYETAFDTMYLFIIARIMSMSKYFR